MLSLDQGVFKFWLEIIRAAAMVGVFGLVFWNGIKKNLLQQRGWGVILAGFGLLVLATALDVHDDVSANGLLSPGEGTTTHFVLKEVVGYFGGLALLFIGFAMWLPAVHDAHSSYTHLKEESSNLEKIVAERTTDLLSTNAALREEVHERHQAEKALHKSRLGLLNAQRIATLGYWERDVATGLIFWSDEVYHLFGLNPEKFSPTYDRFLELVHPDDREQVKNTSLQALYENKPYDIEHRVVRPDGEVRLVHTRSEASYDDEGRPLTATGVVMDITDQKKIEQALRDSEKRFRDFAEVASDWVWEMGPDLRFTYFSDRLYDVLGVNNANVIGKTRLELITDPSENESFAGHVADLEAHRPFRNFVYSLKDDHRETRTVSISGKPVFDDAGIFMGYRGTGSDITIEIEAQKNLAKANTQLAEIANNDPLTGLPNRRNFETHLRRAITRARRSGEIGALFYLDLDNFKAINDTYGHDHGDWALQDASERIIIALREVDVIARLGGDEFSIILENISNEHSASHVAEKIISGMSKPCIHLGNTMNIGVSIGIVFFSGKDKEEKIQDLLRHADQAMYRAKRAGGNVFRFYAPDLDSRKSHRA